MAQTEAQEAAKVAAIAAYESKSSKRASLDEALKQARLRNMAGHEPLATSLGEYVYELQQGPAVSLSRNIAANSQFWATPWKTLGGSALLVHPLAKLGRMAAKPAVIRGHASAMTAFVLSTVQPSLVATGAMDALVKVWQVPGGGLISDLNEGDAMATLRGADGRITALAVCSP